MQNKLRFYNELFFYLLGENKKEFFILIFYFLILGFLDLVNVSLILGFASTVLTETRDVTLLNYNVSQIVKQNINLVFFFIFTSFLCRTILYLGIQSKMYATRFLIEQSLTKRLTSQFLKKKNFRKLSSFSTAIFFESLNSWTAGFADKIFLTLTRFLGSFIVFFILFVFSVFFITPYLILVLIFMIFVYLLISQVFLTPIFKEISVNVKKYSLSFIQKINDFVLSSSVLRDLNLEKKTTLEIVNSREKYNKYQKKQIDTANLIRGSLELFYITCFCAMIVVIYTFDFKSNLPKLLGLAYVFYRTKPFLELIATSNSRLLSFISQITLLYEILLSLENQKEFFEKEILQFKKISISRLNYKLDDKIIFKDASFEMRDKEKIFLFGESGSGKSSLSLILNGSIGLKDCKITINEKNKENINLKVFYNPQKPFLFQASLQENIILDSDLNLDKDKFDNIIQLSNLYDVNKKNKGKIINDNLSQGEKQRLSIARCLYHNNFDIYIFDESTSGLDDKNETTIIRNMMKYYKDKTIIFISHKKYLGKYFDTHYEISNQKINKIKKI